MKRVSIIFLQIVVVFIGTGTLALMLWEPHLEGRNIHATPFEIYFKDPFLAYVYIASISFFVVLYQVFKLLGYIGQNRIFSRNSVRALQTIKYCAIVLIVFITGAEAYFFIFQRGTEDIAGGVAMGLAMIFISTIIGTAAAVGERVLQNGVDMKDENDLTI
ncbi:MAG: DUF2975 domain-containing protein [Prevotella sp.]|jgi:magnesium-transporting ATPase (P-type)|nr:DUF2975 domain-containing protein [Prevotella sp.]